MTDPDSDNRVSVAFSIRLFLSVFEIRMQNLTVVLLALHVEFTTGILVLIYEYVYYLHRRISPPLTQQRH